MEGRKISDNSNNHLTPEWIASRRDIIRFYLRKKWGIGHEDLEEVVQETLLAALKSYQNYEGRNDAEPSTYLLGIANNVAQTFFRKRGRHIRRTAPLESAESKGEPFRDVAEAGDIARLLRDKLNLLPKKYVQVLELVFYKGYKEGEAAQTLGMAPDKFYSCKSDALKRLRKLCGRDPVVRSLFYGKESK